MKEKEKLKHFAFISLLLYHKSRRERKPFLKSDLAKKAALKKPKNLTDEQKKLWAQINININSASSVK